jgi:hypothetical protein
MQTIKLNLIPGSVLPVVNVSQYDVGRHFALQVYEGATAYDLTGKDVQIRGTKPDGNGFAYDSTDGAISVSTNTVTVTTLQQMTACDGQTMTELRITQSGVILGTLNFILMVEPSALSDDTPISETEIPAIERDMQDQVDAAEASALESEGYAVGTQDGVPVGPDSPYYENNAKWYSEHMVTPDLDDLANVNITTPTNGQALIYDDVNDEWVNGAGGGGSSTLAGLTDVTLATPSSGQVLEYDGSKWENNSLSIPADLDDLSDVQLTTPASGQFLKYDGSKWVNGSGGGGGASVLDDLTDVDITTPTAGQVLTYDANNHKWINAAGGGGGTTIVQIPSVVVGTYTYNGSAQGPTISGLDSAHTIVTDDTATNVGDYTLTIALADPQTMVWSDLTTADKTYSWSIGKAPGAVTLSKNTVVLSNSVPSDTVTISNATGSISITSGDTSVATVSPSTMSASGGTLTVTGAGAGTATVTVSVAASSNYDATSATISVTNSIANHIYGAVWDGSADTSWTRTDDAASFADPQPYYAGMSGTPSSPFDNIQPWAGMVRSTDANAGEVVAIPKFYYKMGYASGTTGLKIQIAPASNGAQWASDSGYHVSPAHMDRGDGAGERDVVYVGRYKCASDYKSKTGVTPKVNTTRATFRSGIHALGTGIWQWDYATLVTIWMLYLVEFADWNSQAKIGAGCSANTSAESAVFNMGGTDTIPYHTGTVSSSIGATVYGANQYRHIEMLWGNCFDFLDGIYLSNSGSDINIIMDPSYFSDTTGGTFVGNTLKSEGFGSSFVISSVSGFDWMMFPYAKSGSNSTYICDFENFSNSGVIIRQGGYFDGSPTYGLFWVRGTESASASAVDIGSRLMVLP